MDYPKIEIKNATNLRIYLPVVIIYELERMDLKFKDLFYFTAHNDDITKKKILFINLLSHIYIRVGQGRRLCLRTSQSNVNLKYQLK